MVLMTRNLNKFTAENFLYIFFRSKIAIYLSIGLHKGRPSYGRSLKPSKENIQHVKTWNFLTFLYFCGSFLPSRVRTPNLDPTRIRIRNTGNKRSMNFCWAWKSLLTFILFVSRYNPENIKALEHYVELQAREKGYDLEANLALLKLYQFNPTFYRYGYPSTGTGYPSAGTVILLQIRVSFYRYGYPSTGTGILLFSVLAG